MYEMSFNRFHSWYSEFLFQLNQTCGIKMLFNAWKINENSIYVK